MGLSLRKLMPASKAQPDPAEASLKRCRYISECIKSDSGDGVNIAQMLTKYEPSRPCFELLQPLKATWDRYPTSRPPSAESDPLRDRCLASLDAEIALLAASAAHNGKTAGRS
ncbi:MAG: hypothetical protein EOO40_04390 [Deltaproteobacteria bacterium]|nr:MAG: hypothetical protein EOO40_04390 [Deltaproteobacteria bacterium]